MRDKSRTQPHLMSSKYKIVRMVYNVETMEDSICLFQSTCEILRILRILRDLKTVQSIPFNTLFNDMTTW